MDKTVRALNELSAADLRLRDHTASTDDSLSALRKRRAALREAIPGVILMAYDALDRIGRRPVAVQVRNAHCGGCYLRLPPQLASAIRHRLTLRSCPHCRRLLYSPPEESEKTNESQPEPERSPRKARASKGVRRISGRQPSRGKPPAAERQRSQV
jgi:predicted  nucleic acid-binding Zn-ribbon protein